MKRATALPITSPNIVAKFQNEQRNKRFSTTTLAALKPPGVDVGFYQDRIVPYLVHMSMRQEPLAAYRERVVSAAFGRILEIGIGSGLNLRHYSDQAQHVIGLDPSAKLLSMAAKADRRGGLSVELVKGSAETIPMEDNTVDTVLTTWTLCTIPDANRALSEIRRVLKPGGRLLFVEHGRSPDDKVQRWQDRLNPIWKRIAGGCHLNRSISHLIEVAGFRIERLDTGYMKGPKPMTFMYEGAARSS
jgi:ubiquinone/menaquinone biosynthesis C-methylase UbiE